MAADGDPATSGLDTRHGTAERSPGLLLWQVTNRWQAAQRAALRPFGLTHVQFVLLASLTYLTPLTSSEPADTAAVSQRRLADHAATDAMMTSQVLRALEQRGLVARAPDPHDGRARAVTVTAAGAELANRANHAVEACDETFFAGLAERLPAFTADLARLADLGRPADVARLAGLARPNPGRTPPSP
jgi:DNA-binding MarR family transcriptional regulator